MNGFDVLPKVPASQVHFLCIGTDRITGDALGPLVGMQLHQLGYNVSGTIDEPVHGENLEGEAAKIPSGRIVIAIDACLGRITSIGKVFARSGSMSPGAGIGRELGRYGDYHIKGVVNVGGYMAMEVLMSTRLSQVMRMANEIVEGICAVYSPVEALVAVGKDHA